MFDKILIANRGEIAIRIMRTCKQMGIGTVAVYSEADARNLHMQKADEAVFIGDSQADRSYLVKEKILEVAIKTNCQAIHPGYGFLSENADFCDMVVNEGLTFIGPSSKAIKTMGDKIAAKKLAQKAGVPTVPGHTKAITNLSEAALIAKKIGYPVLLKPAAGGGGKGMRIVYKENEIETNILSCRTETLKAFGDDKIFIEKYILNPRHIEIQVFADNYGNIIYMVERECSIQRRYQKIIEETPSVAVNELLRKKMGESACALAAEAGYANAGTVEYILDSDGNYYFLEMNTRLQVEHPVTEMVTGLDLVELQLEIASGQQLTIKQEDMNYQGWAIEARICADDPSRKFLPSTGMVTRYYQPKGENIRVDSGVNLGSIVGVYYDSLLSKVIAKGNNRKEAINNLTNALNGYHIEGLATNVYYTNAIINHPAFISGKLSTNFIKQHMENKAAKVDPPTQHLHHMALAATLVYHNRQNLVKASLKPMTTHVGGTPRPKNKFYYVVKGEKDVFKLTLTGNLDCENIRDWIIIVDDSKYHVITPEFEFFRRRLKLEIDKQVHRFRLNYRGNFLWGAYCGITRTFEIYTPKEWSLAHFMPKPRKTIEKNRLESPMPGMILDVKVKKGEIVHKGQEVVIIESMKMESGVASPCDATISEVIVKAGQTVETGDVLIKFKK